MPCQLMWNWSRMAWTSSLEMIGVMGRVVMGSWSWSERDCLSSDTVRAERRETGRRSAAMPFNRVFAAGRKEKSAPRRTGRTALGGTGRDAITRRRRRVRNRYCQDGRVRQEEEPVFGVFNRVPDSR